MSESKTLEVMDGTYRKIQQSTNFNRDVWDNCIKPSLFNLLSHRKEAARLLTNSDLTNERCGELVGYIDYCNHQISLLLNLENK